MDIKKLTDEELHHYYHSNWKFTLPASYRYLVLDKNIIKDNSISREEFLKLREGLKEGSRQKAGTLRRYPAFNVLEYEDTETAKERETAEDQRRIDGLEEIVTRLCDRHSFERKKVEYYIENCGSFDLSDTVAAIIEHEILFKKDNNV